MRVLICKLTNVTKSKGRRNEEERQCIRPRIKKVEHSILDHDPGLINSLHLTLLHDSGQCKLRRLCEARNNSP